MRYVNTFLFLTLLFSCISINALAQKKMIDKITKSVIRMDSVNKAKEARGAPILTPIIFPGYTPEAGFLLGAGGLLTFSTDKQDTSLKRSSLPFIITYSTNKFFFISLPMQTYWMRDRIRVSQDLWYKNQPDHYWGVGYENGSTVPQSDSTTRYMADMWQFAPYIGFEFIENMYVGIPFNLYSVNATDLNPLMEKDEYVIQNGTDILHVGIGLGFKYDTRDIPENAQKGFLIAMLGSTYGSFFGGDVSYQTITVDYRQYLTLGREGSTLAWRVNGRYSSHETPWTDMSKIGGTSRLRGYFESRYRDFGALYSIVEYRRMFMKKNGDPSKHGAVVWIGGGYVKSNNLTLEGVHILPNYGIGYRLEMQTRMNMRFDVGFGEDTWGIYFGFQEAF